jgi:hypothetical protein
LGARFTLRKRVEKARGIRDLRAKTTRDLEMI